MQVGSQCFVIEIDMDLVFPSLYAMLLPNLCESCSLMFDSLRSHGLQPARLLCPWKFPGKNTEAGCRFLLQESSQLKNRTHVSCISCIGRWILYHWATWETLWGWHGQAFGKLHFALWKVGQKGWEWRSKTVRRQFLESEETGWRFDSSGKEAMGSMKDGGAGKT